MWRLFTGVGVRTVSCASDEVPEANRAIVVHASSKDGGRHVELFAMEGVVWPSQCVLVMHGRYGVRKGTWWRIGECCGETIMGGRDSVQDDSVGLAVRSNVMCQAT